MGVPVTDTGNTPRVTVLMPVYNAASHVAAALESILVQTWRDFEFLIIDDGSTDRSAQIIRSFGDIRIRFVSNGRNLGLIHTLNNGLDLAQGKYIARMDADDISLPRRLERQVDFMDRNPAIGACGTWVETFGERNEVWHYPVEPEVVRVHLLFRSALAHPAACLRRAAFVEHGLRYDDHYPHAEDFQLWQRASEYFPIANMDKVLLKYNIHSSSSSLSNQEAQAQTLRRIDREALLRLGINASDAELDLHRRLGFQGEQLKGIPLDETERWLQVILSANDAAHLYAQKSLQLLCGELWLQACQMNRNSVARRQISSSLLHHVGLRRRIAFAVRHSLSVLGCR